MEDKPKTKRDVIDPVNVFVQRQKPLILDLKSALKGQIHEIAENIKAKYTKPRKPMTEEQKAKAKARREAAKKAKVKPETAEMGVGPDKPQAVDMGVGPEPEPVKTETKEDMISKIEKGDYTYNQLVKIGSGLATGLTTAVKGKKPTKSELERRILEILKK